MTAPVVACLLWLAPAQGSDASPVEGEPSRDAEIFGGDATPAQPALPEPQVGATPAEAAGRDDVVLGGDTQSKARELVDRTASENDKLTLGSRLYLQLDYSATRKGQGTRQPFSSPSLLDVYLDARPSDRVRAFANGRLNYDFTAKNSGTSALGQAKQETRVQLNELWLKLDIARVVFVTAGKQPIRWGVGRFWNPTDFLNQQFKDPLAVYDERLGVTLVKAHLPIESLGWNLYAIANLDGATRPDQVGGALRAEMLLGLAELSLSVARRKGDALRLGADVSAGLGPIDVKGEVALLHGVTDPYYRGRFDVMQLQIPTAVDRSNDWLPRAVLGVEWGVNYTEDDAVYLGAEYFYNGLGYAGAGKYPYLAYKNAFVPFYTGEHYAALYVLLPSPGPYNNTTFILSTLGNLSDRSFVSRLDYRVRILTYLDLLAFTSVHYGENGEFYYGFELTPIPGVAGLENGIHIARPFVDVGVGLQLKF